MNDHKRPAAKTTRRRGRELLDAIHKAVLIEVAETGLSGLTMEGIARRAETAKTSLYRRWPSPEDMLIEAIRERYPREAPTSGADDLRGDLVTAVGHMRELMTDEVLGRALLALNAASMLRPELHRRMWEEVFEPHGGRFTRRVMEHYAALGHVDSARINDLTADIGESLMMKYAVDHPNELPPRGYEERIVDEVLLPVLGVRPS